MKKLCLFLCVLLTLALFGCEKAPAEQTVPTTVPLTTLPPVTSIPTEPAETRPQKPIIDLPAIQETPSYPVISGHTLFAQETVASINPSSQEKSVISTLISCQDSGAILAQYVHLHTGAAFESNPYQDGIFRIPAREEQMSRNVYDGYILENNQIVPLKAETFSETFTLYGCEIPVKLDFCVMDGQLVIVNNHPLDAGSDGHAGRLTVLDTSGGIHRCIVELTAYVERFCNSVSYFATLDLETGSLLGLLSGFERDVIDSGRVPKYLCQTENGDIFFWEMEDNVFSLYQYQNASKTVLRLGLPEETADMILEDHQLIGDQLLLKLSYTDSGIRKNGIWSVDAKSGEARKWMPSATLLDAVLTGSPIAFWKTANGKYLAQNLISEETVIIANVAQTFKLSGARCLAYTDREGTVHVYDPADGEDLIIDLPENWSSDAVWQASPNSRRLMCSWQDGNGVIQILLIDLDSNVYICWNRDNPNVPERIYEEKVPGWDGNDRIVIADLLHREFFVYDLSGIDFSALSP